MVFGLGHLTLQRLQIFIFSRIGLVHIQGVRRAIRDYKSNYYLGVFKKLIGFNFCKEAERNS